MQRAIRAFLLFSLAAVPTTAPAQGLTVDRIFASPEFETAPLPVMRWMKDGRSYLDIHEASGGGSELVRVDVVTGDVTVLADAAALTTADGTRLGVEDVALSPDERRVLVFHHSVRVWRTNTRGVYHVLDLASRRLTPLVAPGGARPPEPPRDPAFLGGGLASGAADPDLQMFATFSPDGGRVAFVRGNNLWVTDLASGRSMQLTTDGSDDIINGTTDWVYEEELGLRTAFRWSPDGSRIAYWRFDQSAVPAFPIVDEMSVYPTVSVLRYPKAGAPNSRVRVGVVGASGGPTTWLAAGPDSGTYLPAIQWAGADSLAVTRLPRRQNRAELLLLSAASGQGRSILLDSDSAYVDAWTAGAEGASVRWLAGGREFLSASDRSGWRQLYLFNRSGALLRQVTADGADVLGLVAVDEKRDMAYVTVAAPNATQRQVYRFAIHGGHGVPRGGERLLSAAGAHELSVSPTGAWATDVQSSIGVPPTMTVYEFPTIRMTRVIADNARVRATLASAGVREAEFFRVPLLGGEELDGYRIVPPDFTPSRRYPVLMYVYGGPASPQVVDSWSGARYLWHQMLAQHGYIVVVVDNRGAAWRGRDFRKGTQLRLGILESDDQIEVARWLGRQPWVDPARIGIWGWSYGGFLTAMTLGRGGSVFRMGMTVSPVTDWRLYDSIYTERYMRTPAENPDGYRLSAPQSYVAGVTARLLLVHGTGDDNVHSQNTMQLVNRLVAAGKPFDLMLYPNRTHAISGGNTSVHLFDRLTRFVFDNL